MDVIQKDRQYFKFCFYGFLKNLRFFDAFLILFLIEKGLPFTQIGILYAVREIFINLFEIPSGIIADTFGRKKSLIVSFCIYIISFSVFYLSHNFWLFLVAFILFGIGDAFRTGTHKGMIMDYLKTHHWDKQKINYYGHTRSWSQKGSAVSALIAGLIVFYSGSYQNIFLYSIVPYLINLLLIISYPKELNHSSKQSSQKNIYSIGGTTKFLLKNIRKPTVLKIINTSALHTAYLSAVKDYIQPMLVNVALIIPLLLNVEAEKKNGIIIGVIYFFIYLSTSLASKFSSRIAAKNKNKVSYVTLLLGFFLGVVSGIFFINDLWIFSMITFIGIYLVENIRKPILTGFIADHVPNEILTSIISAQSLLKTIITAVLALVFGVIADKYGIGVSLIVVSTILVISSIIINTYSNGRKNKEVGDSNSLDP